MRRRKSAVAGAVVGTLMLTASRAPAIVVGVVDFTDPNNPVINNAIFLNDFVGATRFYNAGFYGTTVLPNGTELTNTTAIVSNIEGGWVWNGHDAFVNGQITNYLIDPSTPS